MRFINIHTCKLLFDIGEIANKINNVSVSPNGRYVITVNEDGTMGIYNLQTLSAEINKVGILVLFSSFRIIDICSVIYFSNALAFVMGLLIG